MNEELKACPVAYAAFADNGNIRIWSREPVDVPGLVPLYAAPVEAQPVAMTDQQSSAVADALEAEYLAVASGQKKPGKLDLETLVRAVQTIRALLARAPVAAQPVHSDDAAVDRFAAAMKQKLAIAREKGRSGWEAMDPAELSLMLREHVEKGDPRDVANFCMFLWALGERIGDTAMPYGKPAVAAQVSEPPPSGYAYRYPHQGDTVIRFNNGERVNEIAPIEAIPYWFAAPQPSAQPVAAQASEPVADCWSNDDGEHWADSPEDIEFVHGLNVGDEYELQASIQPWPERFRVVKVPDETSDEYEVEPVSIYAAPQPSRHELQATGGHPAPCARHCEANAFEIEIRRLKSSAEAVRNAALEEAAKICEWAISEHWTESAKGAADNIAEHIRNRKSAPPQPAEQPSDIHVGSGLPKATCPRGQCQKERTEQPSAAPAAPVAQGLTDEVRGLIHAAIHHCRKSSDLAARFTADRLETILARATPSAQGGE
ncbi:hypothetical protein [Imbroritus primus]|uniref:hypothetical protein n=1 Tax=Imbroritus primus TaxID=3058603 RepID=UPI0002696947